MLFHISLKNHMVVRRWVGVAIPPCVYIYILCLKQFPTNLNLQLGPPHSSIFTKNIKTNKELILKRDLSMLIGKLRCNEYFYEWKYCWMHHGA